MNKYFWPFLWCLFTKQCWCLQGTASPGLLLHQPLLLPQCVLSRNEFLLMGDMGLGNIKSGLWAPGTGVQT